MPTKLNKAGNQQEYVPAGNGDASGEYGYNSGENKGGNKHFQNFKRPESTQVSIKEEKPEEIKTKEIKDIKSSIKDNVKSRFDKASEKVDILVNKLSDESDEQSLTQLNKYLQENEKLKIRFGGAGRNAAGSAWGYSEINLDSSEIHTLRHELGHTFDSYYAKDLGVVNKNYPMSHRLVTQYNIEDEDNKCFNDIIHEELGIHPYTTTISGWKIRYLKTGIDKRENKKASFEKINNIYNKYGDKIFDELTGTTNSREKLNELLKLRNESRYKAFDTAENSPEVKEKHNEYLKVKKDINNLEDKYLQEQRAKGYSSVTFSNSSEIVKAREKSRNILNDYQDLRDKKAKTILNEIFPKEKQDEYERLSKIKTSLLREFDGVTGIVGDTQDYLGVGGTQYPTNGHGSNYFNDKKDDRYSCEIFANFYDCYMSKDQWKRDCLKEMFPRSWGAFEKIIKKFGGEK